MSNEKLLTEVPVTAPVVVEGDAADIVFTPEDGAFNGGCVRRTFRIVIIYTQAVL